MRKDEKRLNIKYLPDDYAQYTAEFDRVGFKSTMYHYVKTRYISKVVTICLKNIRDESGNLVADHNWFNYTYDFSKYGELAAGDTFSFKAKPQHYTKGRAFEEIDDYKLSQPKSVKLICSDHDYIPLPTSRKELLGYAVIKASAIHNFEGTGSPSMQKYVNAYYDWMKKTMEQMNAFKDFQIQLRKTDSKNDDALNSFQIGTYQP